MAKYTWRSGQGTSSSLEKTEDGNYRLTIPAGYPLRGYFEKNEGGQGKINFKLPFNTMDLNKYDIDFKLPNGKCYTTAGEEVFKINDSKIKDTSLRYNLNEYDCSIYNVVLDTYEDPDEGVITRTHNCSLFKNVYVEDLEEEYIITYRNENQVYAPELYISNVYFSTDYESCNNHGFSAAYITDYTKLIKNITSNKDHSVINLSLNMPKSEDIIFKPNYDTAQLKRIINEDYEIHFIKSSGGEEGIRFSPNEASNPYWFSLPFSWGVFPTIYDTNTKTYYFPGYDNAYILWSDNSKNYIKIGRTYWDSLEFIGISWELFKENINAEKSFVICFSPIEKEVKASFRFDMGYGILITESQHSEFLVSEINTENCNNIYEDGDEYIFTNQQEATIKANSLLENIHLNDDEVCYIPFISETKPDYENNILNKPNTDDIVLSICKDPDDIKVFKLDKNSTELGTPDSLELQAIIPSFENENKYKNLNLIFDEDLNITLTKK